MGNTYPINITFEYNSELCDTMKNPMATDNLLIRFEDYYKIYKLNIIFKIFKKKNNSREIIHNFKEKLPKLESGEILNLNLIGDKTFIPNFPLSFSKTKTGYLVSHLSYNHESIFEFETDYNLIKQLDKLCLELLSTLKYND